MTDARGVKQPTLVGWESRPWEQDLARDVSRKRQLAARGPYLAAVPPLIAAAHFHADAELMVEAEDAIRAIARFDAEVTASASRRSEFDDAAEAEIAPLAAVLLRTESASSSEIEGITAGAKALALAAINEKAGQNAKLVTANVTAMQKAMALSDDISLGSVLAAHEALLSGHAYADPGRLRTRQVWIGSNALSPHTATFVPPHHSRISDLMGDLIKFVHRVDLPVLAQVAIAHAQFETIHPFNDGNGRTGRTLVHAMLRHSGVTRRLTLPVSAGLLTDTSAYFEALTQYRNGYVEPIIEQFIVATFRSVENGRLLATGLNSIYHRWAENLSSRRDSTARRLLPHLLNQPAVNVRFISAATGATETAAQRATVQLEDAGILTLASSNRRNRVWLATAVIDELDLFAERVGRRA